MLVVLMFCQSKLGILVLSSFVNILQNGKRKEHVGDVVRMSVSGYRG